MFVCVCACVCVCVCVCLNNKVILFCLYVLIGQIEIKSFCNCGVSELLQSCLSD